MNDLHKYATFSVDLLGETNKINSVFSMGRARIFYKGPNRNRSVIEGEVAEQLASTIPGTPVVGTFDYEEDDFTGHECDSSAFGFIPLDPKAKWVTVDDKTYLEVDVVIWDGRFEEAKDIISKEKHLSMELNPYTMRGHFGKIKQTTYYFIEYAEFSGVTVLGDDVEPCFKDAQFLNAYSKMVSAYAAYIEETHENEKGGKSVMDNITDIVEPEVTTEEVIEETPVVEETTEVTESAIETEVEEITDTESEDNTEETEIVETVETSEETTEFACGEDKTKSSKEEDEEVCEKCGKNPCVCESSLDEEDEADEKDDEDKDDKDDDKEDKYQALETELADFKAKYESLENKYNEALNSLNKYTKKEKLEIISKFSTKLESEELIEKLTNEVDNYSIEDIKSELGRALVEQVSAEVDEAEDESADTNFSLNINITDNNLGNSAWDLVKRHKQSK